MLTYSISVEERDTIEALFFEKNAKDSLLTLLASQPNISADSEAFQRVYNEAVQANVAYNVCFDGILTRHLPKNMNYRDAKIEFIPCSLVIEEV